MSLNRSRSRNITARPSPLSFRRESSTSSRSEKKARLGRPERRSWLARWVASASRVTSSVVTVRTWANMKAENRPIASRAAAMAGSTRSSTMSPGRSGVQTSCATAYAVLVRDRQAVEAGALAGLDAQALDGRSPGRDAAGRRASSGSGRRPRGRRRRCRPRWWAAPRPPRSRSVDPSKTRRAWPRAKRRRHRGVSVPAAQSLRRRTSCDDAVADRLDGSRQQQASPR